MPFSVLFVLVSPGTKEYTFGAFTLTFTLKSHTLFHPTSFHASYWYYIKDRRKKSQRSNLGDSYRGNLGDSTTVAWATATQVERKFYIASSSFKSQASFGKFLRRDIMGWLWTCRVIPEVYFRFFFSFHSVLVFEFNKVVRELKQPRRRRQQKPHKFAYLTMKNRIFARFARAFFIFWHFARTFSFFL